MNATVTALPGPSAEAVAAARRALDRVHRYLDRCKLATNSVKAYRRQTSAYVVWLKDGAADQHPDAFADTDCDQVCLFPDTEKGRDEAECAW